MNLSLRTLLPLALLAVRDPRSVARLLIEAQVPGAALPLGLSLVVVLSVLFAAIAAMLDPSTASAPVALPILSIAVTVGVFLVAYIVGIHRVGRLFGGKGGLEDTALLMIFLQFVLLVAQVVQILLWFVAPPLSGFFVIAALFVAIWINVNFIDVLHNFDSVGRAFLIWLLVTVGIALAVSLLLTLMGVTVQG